MVDQEETLVSVLRDSPDGESREETALWGSGTTNGLVVVPEATFAWQIDAGDGETTPTGPEFTRE